MILIHIKFVIFFVVIVFLGFFLSWCVLEKLGWAKDMCKDGFIEQILLILFLHLFLHFLELLVPAKLLELLLGARVNCQALITFINTGNLIKQARAILKRSGFC